MGNATGESIVTTAAQLNELTEHARKSGRFALDTEFVSEDTFEPVLCLIQLATRERLATIDPPVLHDLTPFWDLVHDPSVQIVMHAAGEDLRICLLRTGALPKRVFDVQIAAGLIGLNYPLSLVNLVGQVLGITLAGSETRTDWRQACPPRHTAQLPLCGSMAARAAPLARPGRPSHQPPDPARSYGLGSRRIRRLHRLG